ncbi:Calcineurin-like metallo-phosphoesterase superfamily protein [Euphorbia peplus]|nr:Calcineurin-like metallo-phosphoesterase superfamily protein [Euphorbia peplus]
MSSLSALLYAPIFCSSSPRPSASSKLSCSTSCLSPMAASIRIVVVGDVHDQWSLEEDTHALQFLQPDLVLFTGDFGNENVRLVRSVAELKFPKAVILGNHDSWTTKRFSQKTKDGVQLQLECLGEEHVGYGRLDFPTLKLSIVGGRPFSCGGEQLFRKDLLSVRYGVRDMNASASRIYNTALGIPEDHLVIFLAHNGPTGLGSNLNDICGKDWGSGGGDHGDPDLAQAIERLKKSTKLNIPLVVFGHMHKELAYGNGERRMIVVGDDKIIYLNGAIVPRVKGIADEHGVVYKSSSNSETSQFSAGHCRGTRRAFTLVEIVDGKVEKIAETWVSVNGDICLVEEEQVLFKCPN